MADENQNDTSGSELEVSDADAEKLLADAVDEQDRPAVSADRESTGEAESDRLGDAGKKAIDAMKRERNAARKELADIQARLKKYEDDGKSESQRLQEALATHQSRAEKAESALKRREVAESRAPEHATAAQIRAVAKRLAGDTDEALEEDADELFALLAPAPPKVRTPDRPKERLKGGSEPDEPVQETDPRKMAAAIPRGQLR